MIIPTILILIFAGFPKVAFAIFAFFAVMFLLAPKKNDK